MRARAILASVVLALALAGCGVAPTAPPSLSTETACPLLKPTIIPPGFVPVERHSVNAGGEWLADITIYRDDSGASLAFASGSPGEIGGVRTGQRILIRGHETEIFHQPARGQLAVTWLEAAPEEPCHQYSISASGLDIEEFVNVLDGVE